MIKGEQPLPSMPAAPAKLVPSAPMLSVAFEIRRYDNGRFKVGVTTRGPERYSFRTVCVRQGALESEDNEELLEYLRQALYDVSEHLRANGELP